MEELSAALFRNLLKNVYGNRNQFASSIRLRNGKWDFVKAGGRMATVFITS
jgi:hypothetical protein